MFRAVLGIHVTKVFFHVAFENTDELKKNIGTSSEIYCMHP